MPEQMYEVVVKAAGEVRDKDGNLISTEPIEARLELNAEQVRELIEGES